MNTYMDHNRIFEFVKTLMTLSPAEIRGLANYIHEWFGKSKNHAIVSVGGNSNKKTFEFYLKKGKNKSLSLTRIELAGINQYYITFINNEKIQKQSVLDTAEMEAKHDDIQDWASEFESLKNILRTHCVNFWGD